MISFEFRFNESQLKFQMEPNFEEVDRVGLLPMLWQSFK